MRIGAIAHRTDKSFPMKSPEMNGHLGGVVLKNFPDIKVDVHHPDLIIYVEVKKYIYIYTEKIQGFGGLPVGSSGRGLLSVISLKASAFILFTNLRFILCSVFFFHKFTFNR